MRRWTFPVAVLVVIGSSLWNNPQAATPQVPAAAAAPVPSQRTRAALDQYCVTCHNERTKTAGLMLDKVDLKKVPEGADAENLEKVVRKLRAGMMPPQGMPRPDAATHKAMLSWIESTLDRGGAANPDPGRPLLHRLNRVEYANVIRDLLALDVDTTQLLPPDDSGSGFDNNADALNVSPALQERYLASAQKVAARAVGDLRLGMTDEFYPIRLDVTQTQHLDGLPLGTRGGRLIRETFPLDGDYDIKILISVNNDGQVRGLKYPHQLIVMVDDHQVLEQTIGTEADKTNPNEFFRRQGIEARLQVRVPLKAGPHTFVATFKEKTSALRTGLLAPFLADVDFLDTDGLPQIDRVRITGPFNMSGRSETPSRRRIFVCRPETAAQEEPCAREILSVIARRAYRRPVTDQDLKEVLPFYETGRRKGSFDDGIELALRFILASPEFVFRVERDPAEVAPGASYRISDLALASRLSFFFWSTIPDDHLLQVASQNRLHLPLVLQQEVKRMMADPKSGEFVTNFTGQWLYLRNLQNFSPNRDKFPEFDDNLRQAFRRETELLFDSVMRENRSVLDLLRADYTFVNERLAKHYGIPGVYGSQFRRVPVTQEARMGLLGHASILAVNSRPDRTSPVLRGKWVLENLLGTPPPPPPANVPPLKDDGAEPQKPRTMREQMEEHRANPVCANCHKLMDPIGLALENFDAIGSWRTLLDGAPIDVSGQLADGSKVDGPTALRQALLNQPDLYLRTLTEKLLTYAIGRGLDYHDMPVVRSIVRDASRNDYRFSSFIMGIVNSAPFRMRVKAPQEDQNSPGRVARQD